VSKLMHTIWVDLTTVYMVTQPHSLVEVEEDVSISSFFLTYSYK